MQVYMKEGNTDADYKDKPNFVSLHISSLSKTRTVH